jgi:tetratricopeptide (TPR) repeat protein
MVKPIESPRAVTWPEDVDGWLAGVPEVDREQALLDLMTQPLSPMQSEAGFARLVRLSSTPANWREWVISRVQRAEAERALALFDYPGNQLHEDPQSNYLKARVLASLRRYEEAVLPLMEAIKRNPHEPMFYEALAHVEVQRQEKSRAIAAFSKVVALDPKQAYAWLNIGLLAQAGGDSALALDALREASVLYLASEDARALDSLLDVLREMNDAGNPEAGTLGKEISFKRTVSDEAS